MQCVKNMIEFKVLIIPSGRINKSGAVSIGFIIVFDFFKLAVGFYDLIFQL